MSGGDATWIIGAVVVLVVVLVAIDASRAARHRDADDGTASGAALRQAGRALPHAVVSVVGTVLVAAGGMTTAATVALLPFALIVEALGGHALGPVFLVMAAGAATLLAGAVLLGRGLRELVARATRRPRRRGASRSGPRR